MPAKSIYLKLVAPQPEEKTMETQVQSRQYLTFRLADEQYGLDVLHVREVLEIPRITRVPRMPVYLKGVINIRGSVVPVVDLRCKLGIPEAERTVHSRVVIIDIRTTNETIALGIQVDSVQEVIDISAEGISPPPQIGTKIDAGYINGIARLDANFVIIINIDKVFVAADLGLGDQESCISEEAPAETASA
jgi:purine-binding chemotaxis protein CheW